LKYKGKFDANVNKINIITSNVDRQYSIDEIKKFLRENVAIESKKVVKDVEFSLMLQKIVKGASIDLKVG
jgi:RNA binding exosome subunit